VSKNQKQINNNKIMRKLILTLLGFSPLIIACSDNNTSLDKQTTLSQLEIDDLTFSREEEKLARDVYIYNYEKYGDTVFNNISKSEQNHMDQILELLNYYSLPDPVIDQIGVFKNVELQSLYNDLINNSNISHSEALKVGAIIEDLDIKDLDDLELRTNKDYIISTYELLKCGSRNHMRSFTNQLSAINLTYEPQFITSEEYNAIINSDLESCGRS